MGPTWRFIWAAVLLMGIWMLTDFIYVRESQSSGTDSQASAYLFFALAYAAFLWAGWPLHSTHGRYARGMLRAVTAAAALFAWLLPATVVLVQFHVAIGGHL